MASWDKQAQYTPPTAEGIPVFVAQPVAEGYVPAGADGSVPAVPYNENYDRTPLNTAHRNVPVGQWRDEVFACFNNIAPSCLMSWCCPCVQLGQITEYISYMSFTTVVGVFVLLNVIGAILAATTGLVTNVLGFLFIFAVATVARERVRSMFSIPGSFVGDCCCSFWCTCCTIAQMARHLYGYREACDECTFAKDGVVHRV